ncbi:oxidoreductase, short chain dehydrogenase/reductase superfamily protein [Acanthamoeba castellanii str. Neff]|uniref:Oxidoreductase, short chain dehydrogenase/reductase superfamily protein n=1 Tax=Acanthamoeba castellanii (strain ATCC 30010 / Neff) TaxID=1257118 RepID=L8GE81_ACACF|nr:oxidoreductase, short chain dehydrogenase/reductase superfamily protein [Acanthamoeba castellanii str. Neff]ELR11144.1 oxidoreductase, short chain dehydrogenase/reductase superfamily protein [Acanthamoeba castellanii str. Neff]
MTVSFQRVSSEASAEAWRLCDHGDYPDTDEWVRGKVCIVTGSNSGLGYYTALYLARMGAHVILACRNIEKAEKARREIIDASGNDLVEVMQVDLASLDSVRNFAREFERRDLPLHVLVNNASVFMTPYANTVDGFERQFQTNYLGPFLLTNLLLPRMIETGNARIVNVSSQAHRIGTANYAAGKLEWDNLQMDKGYSPLISYGRTKLMIAMASYELARRLAQQGVFMTPYANTVDGFERQFQTNYLGPFLLTNLLLPRMIETGNARIVNVSSQAHRIGTANYAAGKLEWDNLQMDKGYSPLISYGRTKLMIAMASYELARRLAQQGAPVTVNVVDPFLADTGVAAYSTPMRAFLFKLLQKLFAGRGGADVRVGGELAGAGGMTGKYFIHNKRQIASSSTSYNLDDAKRLWDVSARLVGLGATRS